MAETGFRTLSPEAAEVRPILRGLFAEYSQRYGNYFAGDSEQDPVSRYLPPQGLFLVLEDQGEIIATGAYKPYNATTAEIKRIWTAPALRGQGIAQRMVRQLEQHALNAGYQHIYLTTGFRQPEAVALYLSLDYQPGFDTRRNFEEYSRPPYDGRLRFTKSLVNSSPVSTNGVTHYG